MSTSPPDTVRRKRSPRRDGSRTTLRVPPELAASTRAYAGELGTTSNDALIRLAERGAAIYEGEREVGRLAAERTAAVLAGDAPGPDAVFHSSDWVDWAMRDARGE